MHINTKNSCISHAGDSGGRRWIRTIEALRNRFTVCPIWPLWNSPDSARNLVIRQKYGAGGRT